MNRNRFLPLVVAALALAACLAVIGVSQTKMNRIVKERRLTDSDIVENAPPLVAFTTIALGCFRGLIADLLWLRSISLQDEGKYFEIAQLADWICKLQPRFTGASAYLAWNMAYNISVTFSDPEDRWRWVRHGVELLREAVGYNPSDANLYRELGWLYQHKIGNIFDDANLYYKEQMAIEMTRVFGGPAPDWKALAETPRTADAFWKGLENPKAMTQALKASGINTLAAAEKDFREQGRLPEKLAAALGDTRDREKLVLFLRLKWLLGVYKLDPVEVVKIDAKYGRFDWRLPQAYAVYWATVGLERARDPDNVNCERMINQGVKDAFLEGKLLAAGEGENGAFLTVPNLNLADAARKAFRESFKERDNISFTSAYTNFTIDSILIFYSYGDRAKAEAYLRQARKDFPDNREFFRDLDTFVIGRWKENIIDGSRQKVQGVVESLIFQALLFAAFGDDEAAKGHEEMAKMIYNLYKQSQKDSWERSGLPPFEKMKSETLTMCLKSIKPALADKLRSRFGLPPANDADTAADTERSPR